MPRLLALALVALLPALASGPASGLGTLCAGQGDVYEFPVQGGVFYLENRMMHSLRAGVWIYQESNDINWLQEGDANQVGIDPCPGPLNVPHDTLIL